jgi:hypothetical protein
VLGRGIRRCVERTTFHTFDVVVNRTTGRWAIAMSATHSRSRAILNR